MNTDYRAIFENTLKEIKLKDLEKAEIESVFECVKAELPQYLNLKLNSIEDNYLKNGYVWESNKRTIATIRFNDKYGWPVFVSAFNGEHCCEVSERKDLEKIIGKWLEYLPIAMIFLSAKKEYEESECNTDEN